METKTRFSIFFFGRSFSNQIQTGGQALIASLRRSGPFFNGKMLTDRITLRRILSRVSQPAMPATGVCRESPVVMRPPGANRCLSYTG